MTDWPNIDGMEMEQLIRLQTLITNRIQSMQKSKPEERVAAKMKRLDALVTKVVGSQTVLKEGSSYNVQITELTSVSLYVTAEYEERYYVEIRIAGVDDSVSQAWSSKHAEFAAAWFGEIAENLWRANKNLDPA